mgnify:CR=1 FL=1
MTTLDELEVAAKNATPGKWKSRETRVYFPNIAGGFDIRDCPNSRNNATHIALANPDTVLSLIARVREAEAKLEKAREGLTKIAKSAPTAEEMGVAPGMDYWCTVAVRRQDRAVTTLREITS